ncbi:MAG TPA: phosphotransferase [Stellaceae bacterium]|nr:phosphotransferase [Stellaceae bacterium]
MSKTAIMTEASGQAETLDARTIAAALRRIGLIDAAEAPRCRALAGGVSSEIWLAELPGRRWCVKRALPRLKVAQRWEAPIARNRYEYAWFETAGHICPEAVPRLLGQDQAAGLFVMEYLDPASHPVWKEQLRHGYADPAVAAEIGARLARIHAVTAGDPDIARRFATDASFHALRLEPYLLATARVHPDVAPPLVALSDATAAVRRALVHGDVSPKNILIGPRGPVFLDAECAWYGDPAFDVAFVLNHLLLKCLWNRPAARRFLASFDRLAASYLNGVDWEPRSEIATRAAWLLPGLLLARIDGKSPVEYVTDEGDKAQVRRVTRQLLLDPPAHLAAIRAIWAAEVEQ